MQLASWRRKDMKRTRKWAFVGQEAMRLAGLGLSPYAISKKMGLAPSTVTRWVKAGKLQPGRAPNAKAEQRTAAAQFESPEDWARRIRADYALDASDNQLVKLGQQALELANNMAESPTTRMMAAGRYQSILKQLALVTRLEAGQPKPEPEKKPQVRAVAPRSGIDPRGVLQAVKPA